jgi:hypothetical protein
MRKRKYAQASIIKSVWLQRMDDVHSWTRPSSAQELHPVRSGFWQCGESAVVLKKSEGTMRIDGGGFDATVGDSLQRCVSLG